jgi:transposase
MVSRTLSLSSEQPADKPALNRRRLKWPVKKSHINNTSSSTSMILTDPIHVCLGLDISKAKLDACLLSGPRALHAQFENNKSGIAALRAWCSKHHAHPPLTVLEATGRYGELAASSLHAAGHRIHVANPRRIKDHARSLGRRNKTDRIDSKLIAGFGLTRCLPDWVPASPAQQTLRALMRRSAELQALLQAERNRLEAACEPLASKSIARLVRALEKEIVSMEAQLDAHIKASPELRADIERLCQIQGIGERTARWLAAELPRHLPNGRAAAAWLAVTPRIRQSGTSRSTAPSGSDGNRHLRRVLFMAAMVARRHNPRLKSFADRLASAGKSKMAVLIAVLHKLTKISFALLKHHSAYDPNHSPFSSSKN